MKVLFACMPDGAESCHGGQGGGSFVARVVFRAGCLLAIGAIIGVGLRRQV